MRWTDQQTNQWPDKLADLWMDKLGCKVNKANTTLKSLTASREFAESVLCDPCIMCNNFIPNEPMRNILIRWEPFLGTV